MTGGGGGGTIPLFLPGAVQQLKLPFRGGNTSHFLRPNVDISPNFNRPEAKK